ncbi:MAG: GNAT family protein [Bacteriovorax sp.]|jgi:RimJ/RimL family protein N-acetyltransferase
MYKGEKVILRAYEKADINLAHELFNGLELQKLLNSGLILPLSYEEEESFILGAAKNKSTEYNFAIESIDDQKYIGGCGYFKYRPKDGTTWIGIAVADETYWGKGFGFDATKVLIRFLFNELNIRKVTLGVFSYNERAIKCYRKLGFEEEGRLKENFFRDGKYHDEIIMSLFRANYKN